jgi:hypothetical protein
MTAIIVHTAAASQLVPVTQIQFAPSSSPIPGFSGPPPFHHGHQPVQPPPELPDDTTDGQAVPHYYKLSFPTFDGREDPLGWLNHREHFFRGQRTGEAEKVGLASFHMTGAAQHWYFMLERETGIVTWSHFKALCQQRFGPAIGINHLSDLARLTFRSSVNDYMEAFQATMAHVGYLTPEQ